MKERQVAFPTIALIAGTRVALCMGLGLLLANRLSSKQRRGGGDRTTRKGPAGT